MHLWMECVKPVIFISRWCRTHAYVSSFAQEQNGRRAASGVSAMPLAHDAASFNAIAANSAVASRAWVHEKLGRSDVEVSCVCPLLCLRVANVFRLHVSVRNDCAMLGIPGQWKRAAESRKKRCSDSPGIWWPARSVSFATSINCAAMLLCEGYAHRRNGRTT